MEFTIKIDITERLEKSLQALTTAIFNARVFPTPEECRAKYFADVDPEAEYINQEKAENLAVEKPKEPDPAIAPSDPENAPEAKSEQPAEVKLDAVEAAAQNGNVEPGLDKAFKSWVVAVASEQPEKKPAKKRASKKAEMAPVAQIEPEQTITQPEPEIVKTEPALAQSEPESAKAEEPATAADDGMAGMNLMEAAKQLMEDIQDAGVEMADANARVRAKANELGLNFGSITCLIKAIGYVEAKKVAIGK